MLAFLLAKPTQFDAPFFRWMHANRRDIPFLVYYWQPVGPGIGGTAATDAETGSALSWGIDLLDGYNWQQANPDDPDGFGLLLRQAGVRYMVCNGWKSGFAPLIKAARAAEIPLGLRIDSVVWGKTAIEMTIRRFYLGIRYRLFAHFFSSGTVGDEYLAAIGIQGSRCKRWPYCVDAGFFKRNAERISESESIRQQYTLDDRPVILSVCKWVNREHPLEILRAFIRLNDPGLQLVMIGNGPLRAEMLAIRQKASHLSICFTGYVPYAQLPAWYALARVFVHPAQYEPWGVSVQEAMASGCALVASNRVGSGYDLIKTSLNGYQYPSGDEEALMQLLAKALALPAETVQKTHADILSVWNYDEICRQFEGLGK